MRAFITCAVLTVTALTLNAPPAQAQTIDTASLVDSWYVRYLGRHVDPAGLSDQVRAIRDGTPLDIAEAAILSSPEYYVRNGNTPEGYVAALYRDLLGRRAGSREFSEQVQHVLMRGRTAVALRILHERTPPVVVVTQPAPVVVAPPYLVESTVIAPAYRPVVVYVSPRPAISLRFRFGR